jgi:hypothetical protein
VDSASEDEEGKCWIPKSRESRMLPEPLFGDFDALIRRVTLYGRKETAAQKSKKHAQNLSIPHDISNLFFSILQ